MLDPKHAEKPPRKLRQLLKQISSDSLPEEVHALRTHARRMEALIAALAPNKPHKIRKLLKLIRQFRKAAGNVRDMDVLIDHVVSFRREQDREVVVRLVEFLSTRRAKHARELGRVVARTGKEACWRLKRFARQFVKIAAKSGEAGASAAPETLTIELTDWPKLSADNLHSFRIRAKELRYVLQLNPADSRKQIEGLGKAKDVIGEWHDWMELEHIAAKTLDAKKDAAALKAMQTIQKAKLKRALIVANETRRRYFKSAPA